MTKLEVLVDINPSKEEKGKAECRASVNTFSAHSNEDKDKSYAQTEERIIFSIKEVIVSLLEDAASEIENSEETK